MAMKRKKRSIASSRAASLRSWRVKRRMEQARRDDDRPTIDRIPKVIWK